MIRFIDMHRGQFGVELVCRILRGVVRGFLTSRGYRAAKSRPVSARQARDQVLISEVQRLHAENYGVYGVRKMHALLRREGWQIGRDQTARLMRLAAVRGVRRSKKVFTTNPDPTLAQPKDLVKRDFTAPAPCRLWVADITYVPTWEGSAYVAFVIDVFARKIVGWNVASTLKAEVLPLQALNMAVFNTRSPLDELIHHADHGSNYLSVVYTDRIVELGAKPSTGTVRLFVLVFSGVLTLTAMDAQGCWCRVFSGVPDSHSDRHLLSFPGSVGPLRTPGEASRLTAGVT
jgi:hypothetical protein